MQKFTEVKDEKMNFRKLQTSEYGEMSNTLDVPSLEVEEVEMTHEEALDNFRGWEVSCYEEGLSAGSRRKRAWQERRLEE